jgi:F-type H+-transporting ATPase subunit delta
MQSVDEVGAAIADVYARALLEVAKERDSSSDTLAELGDFITYVNSTPAFERFLTAGTVDTESRRAVLEKTMRGRMSDLLLDFLQVLNRKQRMELLQEVQTRYRLALDDIEKRIEATVSSASKLSPESRDALVVALKSYTGSDAVLSENVDPTLIGGMVVHIRDQKIDFSVATKLRGYRAALLARASRELHNSARYVEQA